jgi:prepilin-type N-terminal cleavage/methylation domain-containing protein
MRVREQIPQQVDPRHGVTLIELLVVIAIIAVLASIVSQSLSAARGGAGALKCQANLRQWAWAVHLYAQGNDGYLPRRGQGVQATTNFDRPEDWFNALPPLLGFDSFSDRAKAGQAPRVGDGGLWMCPAARGGSGWNSFSYGMNMWLSTWQDPRPDRIDAVAPTDRQVFMADGPEDHCSIVPANKPYSAIARHFDIINIAFLDGHVARFPGKYVGCGIGDPLRGDVRWVVPNSSWAGPQ